jgi:hypothetical protein
MRFGCPLAPAAVSGRKSLSRAERRARQPNRTMHVSDQYASGEPERERGRLFAIAYGMLGSSAQCVAALGRRRK